MRKTLPVLVVSVLAAALTGCASGTDPQSAAAPAGRPSVTTGSPAASDTDTPSSTPSPTNTAPTTPAKRTTSAGTTKPSSSPKTTSSRPGSHSSRSSSAPSSSASASPKAPGTPPPTFGYSPTADSKAQIDAARAAAKADGREVLLDFGASWCGNCVALDDAFHTSAVQAELASSYHLVQIDADVHMNLVSQYAPSNKGVYGLPVLVILRPDGSTRVDTDKTGNPGFDAASFLAFLKESAD